MPLGLEFDYVQLAGQPAPGEREAWNADALMEGVRVGTKRSEFLSALEDRVRAEEARWTPLLELHYPDLLDDYLNEILVETGQRLLQERADGRPGLLRLSGEEEGASCAAAGGQEEHWRRSPSGAGGCGELGGAPAESSHSKRAAGQHISDFESNTVAVTETKTVLLRRRAEVGVEETGLGGHFSLESIAWWETLGSQEERL